MIRVLQMVSSLDGGGIEKVIFDYYKYMNKDKIHFDFVKVKDDKIGILEDSLLRMGSSIFEIPSIKKDPCLYVRTLKSILNNGHYDVIHCNGGFRSAIALIIAYFEGVPIRIAHAHTSNMPEQLHSKLLRLCFTVLTKLFATSLFACGEQAASWMWGKKNESVLLIRNAIDTNRFKFSKEKRIQLRKEFHLENKKVIGHVGRFSYEKNQAFLIDVLNIVVSKNCDACLVLIGSGEKEKEIKSLVDEKELSDKVLFLGIREDVPDLLNAFDIFVLPSVYEGLPVTLVESQANGIATLASDSITKQMAFNDNISFLPLIPKLWADQIIEANTNRDKHGIINVNNAGYNIEEQAIYLYNIYCKLCGKNNDN